jgi:branched-chain amino acid transport system permease protein
MSTFFLLTVTGLGLGAMYFLIASGLSLIYGLMGVLNFAHGAFITVGSYGTWWTSVHVFDGIHSALWRWLLSSLLGLAFGGIFAALVELVLIRPLYARHIEQVLVTVGLQLAFVALVTGIWGSDPKTFVVPAWLHKTTDIGGAHIPNDRWIEIATAAVVLGLLQLFLRRTRYGLIIRGASRTAPWCRRSASTCGRRSRSSLRSAVSPQQSPASSAASTSTTSAPTRGRAS